MHYYHIVKFDEGWGCGYRYGINEVPQIFKLQKYIEDSWSQGFDPAGASHFDMNLKGSHKMIGAVDLLALLTYLGVQASLVECRSSSDAMFDWIWQYFVDRQSYPTGSESDSSRDSEAFISPIFFQFAWHCKIVIGIESTPKGKALLMLDPSEQPQITYLPNVALSIHSIRQTKEQCREYGKELQCLYIRSKAILTKEQSESLKIPRASCRI
ncbi:putative zinc finger with UFM1-specific peptidase domain-like [Monocercomonoides exilis]|uniref:putative zinc finger with UFM1-specific peptidase domain-like n=1 Tax=Monocercomonoides exilis TaxID=2049356 RepID=UPI00355A5DF0|nr:putative zinc finger with UFM1-specific peptidase domain-like [Monocercomonoides exilis]|eukprot:MONOS_860.1-p1 / transcript=MONOS_860.1 / gene=MONOS_860 / organism=Monocercomonoides_exilis_PA203 / gene_product=zinc finger with UFM1-specific peptidase domain-like / transcript_product=zinc finger with UFM1-specific peptidase domain-like / location=Mono_scaffold00014:118405-119481(+) / protein_length=211 / sequence_SO=supercontig / SO=protein_coding / is_pseudo=false